MIVNFTKMHGLGNDFVVIDLITQGARLNTIQIKQIADRKFGIGCDQVILLTPPTRPDADFFYRIFNADGYEVEQCGNGVRCAAKFFLLNGLTNKTTLIADCQAGAMEVQIDEQQITVNVGKNYSNVTTHALHMEGMPNEIHAVTTGNPHGVCIVDDLTHTPVLEWGKTLTKDPMFPNEANISFVQVLERDHVRLRVYERGVGPTLSCGSAACATLLVGKALHLLDNKVTVSFEYGDLLIDLMPDQTITMTGPANSVYLGRFRI